MASNDVATVIPALGLTHESLRLALPTKQEAIDWVSANACMALDWQRGFKREQTLITYPGCGDRPIRLIKGLETMQRSIEEILTTPGIESKGLYIGSEAMMTALSTFLERPTEMWGLVEIPSQTQVAVNNATYSMVGTKAGTVRDTLKSTVGRSRHEYWHPGDLDDVMKRCRQELAIDAPKTITVQYRVIDPVTNGNPRRITAELRAINSGGVIYQVSKCIDVAQIKSW